MWVCWDVLKPATHTVQQACGICNDAVWPRQCVLHENAQQHLLMFLLWCVIIGAWNQASVWPPSILWVSPVIVRPSHVWWDYIHLLCKAQQVQTCSFNQLFQPRAGLCLTTAVQNNLFPTANAAFMWNVRQQKNNLGFCTSSLSAYIHRNAA